MPATSSTISAPASLRSENGRLHVGIVAVFLSESLSDFVGIPTTWANPSGESIKALQAQLGHTDSRLTLSVYTQPMPEAQKLLACKIASVLLRSAPKSEVQQAEAEVVIP